MAPLILVAHQILLALLILLTHQILLATLILLAHKIQSIPLILLASLTLLTPLILLNYLFPIGIPVLFAPLFVHPVILCTVILASVAIPDSTGLP